MTDPLDRIRVTYDTVAERYLAELGDELDHKPLDRALLASIVELAGGGPIADVGCGPGHVTAHLAAAGARVVGVDLSPAMIAVARRRHPALTFTVGSMTALDVPDGAWAAAVVLYAIIHLDAADRARAYGELARVIRPGGHALVAFHVASADHAPGDAHHLDEWWGHAVDLDAYFLEPEQVHAGLVAAGFTPVARLEREPIAGAEYPSRRAYLLVRR
ncbi:MAG TPA: class I SAM-dependent methyltransferase [Kofleriaceae bacterium]|nr:class I SAM-dependent methyltransferase [Kofleriaceae bacterium]